MYTNEDEDVDKLFFAAATNGINYVRGVLEKNPSMLNIKNEEERTLVFYPVLYRSLDMLKLILSFKPDLSIKDKFGLTVYDYAYNLNKNFSREYLGYLNHLNQEKEEEEEEEKEYENQLKKNWENSLSIHNDLHIHYYSDYSDSDSDDE